MSPQNSRITDPEYIKLLKFLVEKTKNVKSPLSLTRLAGEFKEKNKSPLTTSGVRDRILSLRQKIYAMEQIDTETKVKLMFALSARIDTNYLEKLKENAEVTLDDHNRIIEYKTKGGGGLQLKEKRITKSERDKLVARDKRMLSFFAQKAMNVDSPINVKEFVREFKATTGDTESFKTLENRFTYLKEKIHESANFDEKTNIRMLFLSGASVPNSFLLKLRENALVEVDEENRITKYEANDGRLNLQKRMSSLIRFITEKCENVTSPLNSFTLVKDYTSSRGIPLVNSYQRIKEYCQDIQKLDDLDTPTKVRQLFGMGAPLNIGFLERLRKDALVEVDDQNRIIKYVANDGSLTLEGDHSRSAKGKRAWAEQRGHINHTIKYSYNKKDNKIESEKLLKDGESYSNEQIWVDESEDHKAYDSKRIKSFETDRLEDYDPSFNDFQMPEVKLVPFRGSLFNDFHSIDPDEDVKVIPTSELREPKKEIEEEPIKIEIMEFPIKTEEDFITPKQEELEEEEDLKLEFTS